MNDFYYWLQQELEQEINKVYKKIHRIGIFSNRFYIWFLNNDDSISIPLDVMENIYDNEKSIKQLVAVIDNAYLARIKK
jgi:hypothetical protein